MRVSFYHSSSMSYSIIFVFDILDVLSFCSLWNQFGDLFQFNFLRIYIIAKSLNLLISVSDTLFKFLNLFVFILQSFLSILTHIFKIFLQTQALILKPT
jgi:hypothetical protein